VRTLDRQDTRIRRAKRVLVEAAILAERAREYATSRSTGSRRAYQLKSDAAEKALEILSERPPRA
jgi:hypothetical protein